MADLTEKTVYRGGATGYGLKYKLIEVDNATTADTVTVGELTTILDTVAVDLSTGADVACTEATNVVTIGGAVASVPLSILVIGH